MLLPITAKITGPSAGLLRRLETWNAAANHVSAIAHSERIFDRGQLHKRCYREVRERFALIGIETAFTVLNKVLAAYKVKERRAAKKPIQFRPHGAVPVFKHSYKRAGLILIHGVRYPIVPRPGFALSARHAAKLCWTGKRFMIHQPLEVAEAPLADVTEFLGCDLGIVNILADSDGVTYAGAQVNGLRRRHARLRSRLQSKGTRSAKRLLQKRRRRESRFARDVNHCISKKVLAKACDTGRGIALEDLGGIRDRIKVRKVQRRQHHSWSFHQLRFFLEYKAKRAGVPVVAVDPRNTSRTCPSCGHVAKENRKSRDLFQCVCCGLAGPADTIAATNIAAKAAATHGRVDGFQPDAAPHADQSGVAATRERGKAYLHTNGSLIYKRDFGDGPPEIETGGFVRRVWACAPERRELAWRMLVEALALGADRVRVNELAATWGCNNEDAAKFAEVSGLHLRMDGDSWFATFGDFINLAESPAGFGDSALAAFAELARPGLTGGGRASDPHPWARTRGLIADDWRD